MKLAEIRSCVSVIFVVLATVGTEETARALHQCNDKLFACGAVLPALASSVNIGSVGWDTSRGREN